MSHESDRSAAADWLRPDWLAPPGVRAVFTTRGTGASLAPWNGFNLGDHVGDAPHAVAANRDTFRRATGALPFFLHQPHGIDCVDLDALQTGARPTADACVATLPGRACTVMVADCLPVLLCDAEGRAVAAAHAGWRGLAAGVLESTVHALRERIGEPAAPLLAWLGPCIGPQAFEVGDEVRAAFLQADPAAADHFGTGRVPGKWLADLAGLARRRLRTVGVENLFGNDSGPDWCTVGQPSRFFSHRRDAARLGGTGRMAAAIWRLA